MSSVERNSFSQDVGDFARKHKILCILTLGLAVVGYSIGNLAGRVVYWISECWGTTQKTRDVGLRTLEGSAFSGDKMSTRSLSSPLHLLSRVDLDEANGALREAIISAPPYTPSPEAALLARGIYRGGPLPKEFMDSHTHQHRVFENVYLGDLRGYLSVDPEFIAQHPISDIPEDILALEGMTPQLRAEATRHLNQQMDRTGCSMLGIRYVLSATQFRPSDRVPADDWSRFNPDLNSLGIQRLQMAVDDDGFAWSGIEPHLEEAFEFIDRARRENSPCLIHCVKGASRSVTVLTAYLMNRCGVTMDQAFNFIQIHRTIAELKPDMINGLMDYERHLV